MDKARVTALKTRQANVTLLSNTFDSLKTQVADLQTKAQALAQVAMKLGQAMYEREQAAAAQGGSGPGAAYAPRYHAARH